jgi:hypothetical protein
MLNIKPRTGVASSYDTTCAIIKMMRLLLVPAPQRLAEVLNFVTLMSRTFTSPLGVEYAA